MSTPENLKLAKSDEWVNLDGTKGTIGISEYAQDQLSDIVYVEFLKEPGDKIGKGEVLATIESVKAAADINTPVSGVVLEVNETLIETPEILNSDPFGNGWLAIIELEKQSELDELLSAADYDSYCESR